LTQDRAERFCGRLSGGARLPAELEGRKVLSLAQLPRSRTCCTSRAARSRSVTAFSTCFNSAFAPSQVGSEHGDVLVVSITATNSSTKVRIVRHSPRTCGLNCSRFATRRLRSGVEEPSASPSIKACGPHFFIKGGEYHDPKLDITGKIVTNASWSRASAEARLHTGHHLQLVQPLNSSSLSRTKAPALSRQAASVQFRGGFKRRSSGSKECGCHRRRDDHRPLRLVDAMGKAQGEHHRDASSHEEAFAAALSRSRTIWRALSERRADHLGRRSDARRELRRLGARAIGAVGQGHVCSPSEHGRPCKRTRFVERLTWQAVRSLRHGRSSDAAAGRGGISRAAVREPRQRGRCDRVRLRSRHISGKTVDLLQRKARFLAVNAQSNARQYRIHTDQQIPPRGCECLTPWRRVGGARQARQYPGHRQQTSPGLVDCGNILITSGRAGCYAKRDDGAVHIPSFAAGGRYVGAGDAFFALRRPASRQGPTVRWAVLSETLPARSRSALSATGAI